MSNKVDLKVFYIVLKTLRLTALKMTAALTPVTLFPRRSEINLHHKYNIISNSTD